MRESVLEVPEGSDPSVRIVIKDPANNNAAFSLGGYTLEFYVKESPSAPNGTPLYTTANGSIVIDVPDTLGTAKMQMSAVDLASPNRRWFRLDGIKAGKRLTLGYGLLKIKDV